MEEVKIRELSEKSSINTTDHLVIEDADGTKKVSVKHFRSLVLSTLYFNSMKELKESSDIALREGDTCETLGYHYPGDGGGATYIIKYDPAAVDDGRLVHNLAYSDTLRAEMVLGDKLNVHQFGAYGDGVTDDTAAIQAAIDNSTGRTIEFSNGKRYCVNESLIINKSNTIINGNGAILYPLYVEGIKVTTPDNMMNTTQDVSINKLHFDCSRAVNAVDVFRASKVDINGCTVYNVSDTGVNLSNCSFITIDNCHLLGNSQNSNNLITVNGRAFEFNTPSLSCKFIDIEDTKFSNFAKAININSTGSQTEDYSIISLTNCRYDSVVNNSYCVYASCPVELLNINHNTTAAATTFLYVGGASGGSITCKDLSCLNTSKIFDIGSTTAVLRLDGSMNTSTGTTVFERMIGKLYSNIMWESLASGASFNLKPTGEISDIVNPYNYNDTKGYNITGSRLTINEARNMHVNWTSSTNNLTEIVNGVKGQLMYLRSSTGKSITAVPNKIVLSEPAIKLGTYYGVMLKYDGLKWTQISNLTTVSALSNSIPGNDIMGGGGNSPSGGTTNGPIILGGGQLVDKNTTYTLLKDGNEIKLVSSDDDITSVTDENTTYTLEDFGINASPDEINKLKGCTVTNEELNILDGVIVNTDELNQLYNVTGNVQTQVDSKAPINHASTETNYGIGNSQEYGHVKVSDAFVELKGSADDGIAASQSALYDSYMRTQEQIGGINTEIANVKVDINNKNTAINNTINQLKTENNNKHNAIDTEISNIKTSLNTTNTNLTNLSNNVKNGSVVAGKAKQLETSRNIKTNLGSTAAAAFNGTADVNPGVSGTLPVGNGGTGATSLASGQLLVGNGTSAVTTRGITNNTGTGNTITGSTNIPTMNTLKNALNRTTSVAAADTNYGTIMARGIGIGTGDAPDSLPNGAIWIKYKN